MIAFGNIHKGDKLPDNYHDQQWYKLAVNDTLQAILGNELSFNEQKATSEWLDEIVCINFFKIFIGIKACYLNSGGPNPSWNIGENEDQVFSYWTKRLLKDFSVHIRRRLADESLFLF